MRSQKYPAVFQLYSRPNSPYIWARYTPAPGQPPKRESTRKTNEREADDWLSLKKLRYHQIEIGAPVVASETLPNALGMYLVNNQALMVPEHYENLQRAMTAIVVPYFGKDRIVGSLTDLEVEGFAAMVATRPNLNHVSRCCRAKWGWYRGHWVCRKCKATCPDNVVRVNPATVNRLFESLRPFGEWCVKHGLHAANPWVQKKLEETNESPPVVKPDVFEKMLEVAGAIRSKKPWREALEFCELCGLRLSNLSRLREDHIDYEGRTIRLPSKATSTGPSQRNKGGREITVLLSDRMTEILRSLPKRKDGLVFGPLRGTKRLYEKLRTVNGNRPRSGFHLLRHTAVTRFHRTPGATVKTTQEHFGWASPAMAMRYDHPDETHRRSIQERADAARAAAKRQP